MKLIIDPLVKAAEALQKAIDYTPASPALLEAELRRDAIIQRFEFTFELSWKMMKRAVETAKGRGETDELFSKKDLFRWAHQAGLIDDPEKWFAFQDARNYTVHAYDEAKAKLVFDQACAFAAEASLLISRLREKYDIAD